MEAGLGGRTQHKVPPDDRETLVLCVGLCEKDGPDTVAGNNIKIQFRSKREDTYFVKVFWMQFELMHHTFNLNKKKFQTSIDNKDWGSNRNAFNILNEQLQRLL
jgi:hypothetical protein